MTNKLKTAIHPIVRDEVDRIKEQHGRKYNSDHEAYAVLSEEVEEAQEELRLVWRRLAHVWNNRIRQDLRPGDNDLTFISARAVALAAEAIQIAAVARKWKDGNREDGVGDETDRWYYERIIREEFGE
jgi:hypothetical protein